MKDHLKNRIEGDKMVMEKYLGRNIPKEFEEWERQTMDPTVQIKPMSQMFPISERRIGCVKIALRIMQGIKVPTERAHQLARACGHDGEIAWRIEDYGPILIEKWGSKNCAYFTDAEFNKEMNRRSRKISLPDGDFPTPEIRAKYYDCVKTLRASLWGMEYFDIPPEAALHWMSSFRWRDMWTNQPLPGVVAFEIEDYAARTISRREKVRH